MQSRLARWVTSRLGGGTDDTTTGPPTAETEDFETVVEDFRRALVAACLAGDLEAYMTCIDKDFIRMPVDAPPIIGEAAIRAWAKGFFETLELEEFTVDNRESHVFGDFAWFWGTHYIRSAVKGQEPSVCEHIDGKHLTVLKKQADGS